MKTIKAKTTMSKATPSMTAGCIAMEHDKSDSLFVPERSPTPIPRYVVLPMYQMQRLTQCSDNGFEAIKTPQAFEDDRSQITVPAEGSEEIYDPGQEPLPDHPYFGLDIPTLRGEIDAALRDLWISLQEFEDDDAEMKNQREVTQRGRVIGAPQPLVVTTVGPAGVGKSFLYRALFNRPNITKSSAEGRSCTLYPTKITALPEAAGDTTKSDIDIEFFEAATIATITQNHIRKYHQYHFDLDSDPTDDDSRRHASTAEEFFDVAFDAKGNAAATAYLRSLLTAESISNGDLFQACIDAIELRVSSSGTIEDRKLCYSQVEDDDIDHIRTVADSLAPFVDFLVIKTGAPLLEAGLTFIDLPGKPSPLTNLISTDGARTT